MNVYGEINGRLTQDSHITGTLSAVTVISGTVYLPEVAGADVYDGTYDIMPLAFQDQTLSTQNKLMREDITVYRVPYYQTSNTKGDTVYIASEV